VLKNFLEMPRWLKLLTVASFAVPVLALAKPFSGIGVFGEDIDPSTWWRTGSGLAFILPALIMGLSAVLLLRRSQYGRPTQVVGWVAMTVGTYVAAHLMQINPPMLIPGIAFNSGITLCIAIYLYFNKDVRSYFKK